MALLVYTLICLLSVYVSENLWRYGYTLIYMYVIYSINISVLTKVIDVFLGFNQYTNFIFMGNY